MRRIPCARGIWRASRWPILSASGNFTVWRWIFRPPCSSRAPTPRCWCRRSSMSWIPARTAAVLDLCAGSGCIGLAVAQAKCCAARVLLGDVGRGGAARSAARTSAATRLSAPRDEPAHGRAREALAPARASSTASFPTRPISPRRTLKRSIPPCATTSRTCALDGGADGLDFYRVIADKWRDALLAERTALAFEVGIGPGGRGAAHHARERLRRHPDRQGPARYPPRGLRTALQRDLTKNFKIQRQKQEDEPMAAEKVD